MESADEDDDASVSTAPPTSSQEFLDGIESPLFTAHTESDEEEDDEEDFLAGTEPGEEEEEEERGLLRNQLSTLSHIPEVLAN